VLHQLAVVVVIPDHQIAARAGGDEAGVTSAHGAGRGDGHSHPRLVDAHSHLHAAEGHHQRQFSV